MSATFINLPPEHCQGIIKLNDLAIISCQGVDTLSFLQGQFTCDLSTLAHGQSQFGAYCDRKGRMICNFHVVRQHGDYLLCLPHAMIETTLTHLNKYKLFAKTTLNHNPEYSIYGFSSDSSIPALPKEALVIHLPPPCHHQLIIIANQLAPALWTALNEEHSILRREQWDRHCIESGFTYINTDTSEQFLPQMLNMDQLGGISFNKGCYIGQEIVARTQHLGKIKKRAKAISFESQQAPHVGGNLPAPQTGTIVALTKVNSTFITLAVIREEPNQ